MFGGHKAFGCLHLPSEDPSVGELFTQAGINAPTTVLSRAQPLLEGCAARPAEARRCVPAGSVLESSSLQKDQKMGPRVTLLFPCPADGPLGPVPCNREGSAVSSHCKTVSGGDKVHRNQP